MLQKQVKIYTFSDLVEANWIKSILEQEKISVSILSYEDTAFDGTYTQGYGAGEIVVFERDAERAKKIIEESREKGN